MKIRLIVFFCAFGAHVMPLCGDNLWVRHDNLLRTEEDFVRASNLVERASKAGLRIPIWAWDNFFTRYLSFPLNKLGYLSYCVIFAKTIP